MNSELNLQWTLDPNGNIIGTFKDTHNQLCCISKAAWGREGRIYISTTSGAIVLTPDMCAQLALVLGYVAFTGGELPEPTTGPQQGEED